MASTFLDLLPDYWGKRHCLLYVSALWHKYPLSANSIIRKKNKKPTDQQMSQTCDRVHHALHLKWQHVQQAVFVGCLRRCYHRLPMAQFTAPRLQQAMYRHKKANWQTDPFNGLFSRTTWVSQHQQRLNQSGFYNEARDVGMAVASSGPYANHLHLATDR